MCASSDICAARRASVASRSRACSLPSATSVCRARRPSRSAGAKGASGSRAAIDNGCASRLAIWRNDGMTAMRARSRIPGAIAGNVDQGARRQSSSSAASHCVRSARAHSEASVETAAAPSSTSTAAWAKATNCSRCACAAASVSGGSAVDAALRVLANCVNAWVALPPAACTAMRRVSPKPWNNRWPTIGASAISTKAACRVIRWPARFPLSTVEM